jgi:hypothetical protein
MKTIVACVLLAFGWASWGQWLQRADVTFDQAPPGAPVSDADDFVGLLADGNYGQASDAMTDCASGTFTPDVLQQRWEGLLKEHGQYMGRSIHAVDEDAATWHIHVLCTFEQCDVDVVVDFATIEDMDQPTGVRFFNAPDGRMPRPIRLTQ